MRTVLESAESDRNQYVTRLRSRKRLIPGGRAYLPRLPATNPQFTTFQNDSTYFGRALR